MKKALFGIIVALVITLTFAIPVSATPTQSIEISEFKVEIVSGGTVGVETTVRISANVKAEATTDVTIRKDMASCQGLLKYHVIDSSWYLIASDKVEEVVSAYEYPSYNGPGAHAEMDWQAVAEYTWIPYIGGTHYISAEIYGYTGMTDGSWPPQWINDYVKEYHYAAIEIAEAPLSSWLNNEDFEVMIGTCYSAYDFDGLILNEDINQECLVDGHVIGLQMISGTMILGTGKLQISYDGADISIDIPADAIFSQPVTITVDGNPVLIFTSISGGLPY